MKRVIEKLYSAKKRRKGTKRSDIQIACTNSISNHKKYEYSTKT